MAAKKRGPGGPFSGLSQFSPEELDRFLQSFGKRPPARGQRRDTDDDAEERLLNWQDAMGALCGGHRGNHQRLGSKLHGSVELKTVDPEGSCEVVLKCGAATYRAKIEFDFDDHTYAANANCGHHDLCEHTYFVAQKLEAMLEDPKSELVKRIAGVDPAQRDIKKAFSLLQSLAQNAQLEQMRSPASMAAEDKPLQRFIWDLSPASFGEYELRR